MRLVDYLDNLPPVKEVDPDEATIEDFEHALEEAGIIEDNNYQEDSSIRDAIS